MSSNLNSELITYTLMGKWFSSNWFQQILFFEQPYEHINAQIVMKLLVTHATATCVGSLSIKSFEDYIIICEKSNAHSGKYFFIWKYF